MSRLVQVAWLLPSLWVVLYAARVAIADLREGHGGRSWCPACRDELTGCDCEIPCEAVR